MPTRTLLIAEDEENDVFFLKRALAKAGIENPLQVVDNGQAVVDYLAGDGPYADRERFPIPEILLLDLKLPCINGIDVLKWIRNESNVGCLPVIVLTSSTLKSDLEAACRAGANSFITKPSDPEALVEMVRHLADWWLKHNLWHSETAPAALRQK